MAIAAFLNSFLSESACASCVEPSSIIRPGVFAVQQLGTPSASDAIPHLRRHDSTVGLQLQFS